MTNSTATPDQNKFDGLENCIPFDCSDVVGSYLLLSKRGNPLRLSAAAYYLLRAVSNGISFEEVAQALNSRPSDSVVSPELLRAAHSQILSKLQGIEKRPRQRNLPWGFWIRLSLLPREIVGRLGRCLCFLYYLPVVVAILLSCVLSAIAVTRIGSTFTIGDPGLLPAYVLFVGSLVFHELGHTSAVVRYGAEPSDIGFTVYLIYPAFYSDVTECWRLARWQRVVVDLGGCYFQCLYAVLLYFAYKVTGLSFLRLALLMVLYGVVIALNPLFKFDGYWVLADALGIPHLQATSWRLGASILARAVGFRRATQSLPTHVRRLLLGYFIISTCAWARLCVALFPMLMGACRQAAIHMTFLWLRAFAGECPDFHELFSFIPVVYTLVITAVMLYQLSRVGVSAARRALRLYQSVNLHPTAHYGTTSEL